MLLQRTQKMIVRKLLIRELHASAKDLGNVCAHLGESVLLLWHGVLVAIHVKCQVPLVQTLIMHLENNMNIIK